MKAPDAKMAVFLTLAQVYAIAVDAGIDSDDWNYCPTTTKNELN
jgi:hypothetical protein